MAWHFIADVFVDGAQDPERTLLATEGSKLSPVHCTSVCLSASPSTLPPTDRAPTGRCSEELYGPNRGESGDASFCMGVGRLRRGGRHEVITRGRAVMLPSGPSCSVSSLSQGEGCPCMCHASCAGQSMICRPAVEVVYLFDVFLSKSHSSCKGDSRLCLVSASRSAFMWQCHSRVGWTWVCKDTASSSPMKCGKRASPKGEREEEARQPSSLPPATFTHNHSSGPRPCTAHDQQEDKK